MKKIDQTLVILPGWGGTKHTWQDFVTKAKQCFKDVIVIELPCFGDEPCPNTVWGVEEYATFVRNRLPKENGDIALLGHSFGGAVAATLVSQDSSGIKQLILAAPAIVRPQKRVKRAVFYAVAKVGKAIFRLPFLKKWTPLAEKILHRTASSPDYGKTDGMKREIYKKIVRQDIRPRLKNIQVGTLLIWGTKDTMTPFRYAKKVLQELPRGELRVMPNARHGLHHNASLDQFLAHTHEFLS